MYNNFLFSVTNMISSWQEVVRTTYCNFISAIITYFHVNFHRISRDSSLIKYQCRHMESLVHNGLSQCALVTPYDIGSGLCNGLLLEGTEPLPELLFISPVGFCDTHRRRLRYQFAKWVWKIHLSNYSHISKAQWVNFRREWRLLSSFPFHKTEHISGWPLLEVLY